MDAEKDSLQVCFLSFPLCSLSAALPALDVPPLPPPARLPEIAASIDEVVPASAIPKELELDERVLDEREGVLQAEVVSVEWVSLTLGGVVSVVEAWLCNVRTPSMTSVG